MKIIVNKKKYEEASFPMDLISLDEDMGFDFLLSDIKKINPNLFKEEQINDDEILITFYSEIQLISAAKKFIVDKNK